MPASRLCASAAFTVVFLVGPMGALAAQEAPQSAAFLFGYRPHEAMEAQFHEGYRHHLAWHREHGDSLIWYGWTVLTGDDPGVFVDGTFGRPFLALDRRVDPAGDQRDFAATAGSYARAIFRRAYALRRDLSTGTPLEDGAPTPLLEVWTYRLQPGSQDRFERALRAARDVLPQGGTAPPVTWYELVNGGAHPTFLALVHRRGLAGWDGSRMSIDRLVGSEAGIDAIVAAVASETWRYLPSASLIPER